MRLRQISEHIYSLGTWMVVPIHVWLVRDGEGITLVDAGIGPMARGIRRAVDRIGHGAISRIVLTHGHLDHVGAIPAVRARKKIPVLVHEKEIPYMEGAEPYPGRKKAQQTVAPGVVEALEYDDDGGLTPVGSLTPYFTPGHSPGHVVWFHREDGVLLGGDLFSSRNGELRPPFAMFTSDMAQAMESAHILERLKPARLEVCHGGPVMDPADQLGEYLRHYS